MSKHVVGNLLNAGRRGLTLAQLRNSAAPCASRMISSSPFRSAAPPSSNDHHGHDHGHDHGDGNNGWLFGENVRSAYTTLFYAEIIYYKWFINLIM
jgi:hypothetical protein